MSPVVSSLERPSYFENILNSPNNTILIICKHTKAPDRRDLNIRLEHLILITGCAMLIT
jgi:hypothetical protein